MSSANRPVAAGGLAPRNTFPMGFRHLTSMDFGRLQPVVCQEAVAGDDINLNMCEAVATLAPLAAPLQTGMIMHMAAFFVPNRVVWSDFNKWITGISSATVPYVLSSKIKSVIDSIPAGRSRTDYRATLSSLGYPLNITIPSTGTPNFDPKLSALPIRCFNRVWWDWFRDANVIPDSNQSSYIANPSVGYDVNELNYLTTPRYAVWQHHFLTSTLRTPNGDSRGLSATGSITTSIDSNGLNINPTSSNVIVSAVPSNISPANEYSLKCASGSSSANINSLRVANALQGWLEKCNVLGYRLRDRLRGMFGSTVSPETLQMSEYLGQTSFDLNQQYNQSNQSTGINDNTDFTPFGTTDASEASMAGQLHGQTSMTKNGLGNIRYHAAEHGYFLVIAWLLPDLMLTDGIEPSLLRGLGGQGRFEFLTSELVNTGFEPLTMDEVCVPMYGVPSTNYAPKAVLGWRGRYENYKYNKDRLSGCFEDPATRASMRNWYLNRDLLREAGCIDGNFNPIASADGGTIIANITHDTISNASMSRVNTDDRFVIPNDSLDHVVCQFKVDLQITRSLPAVVAPRIELVSSAPSVIGGTHL